jgi:hypothetical protein
MKDTRLGEPVVRQFLHAVPRETVFLAPTPKGASPEVGHRVPKRLKRPAVCRDCKVGEMPENDLPQPQRSRELTHICSVKRTHLRSRRCWNRMTAQYGNVRLTLVGSRLG